MQDIIFIKNLNYENIFEDINIKIKKGTIATISGHNNCGKTTLIRILNKEIDTNNEIFIKDKKINDYKLNEYNKIVQAVIPTEILFVEKNLEDEILYYNKLTEEDLKYIIKELKIKSLLKKEYKTYTIKEIIISQIILALIKKPEILLLDNIFAYYDKKEVEKIITFLKKYQIKTNITIIITTLNLNESLYTDYLYIINNRKIALEGNPINTLEKDNIINKIGLNIPFMIDLSVKLRDYDLIKDVELDMNRMIDKLWK